MGFNPGFSTFSVGFAGFRFWTENEDRDLRRDLTSRIDFNFNLIGQVPDEGIVSISPLQVAFGEPPIDDSFKSNEFFRLEAGDGNRLLFYQQGVNGESSTETVFTITTNRWYSIFFSYDWGKHEVLIRLDNQVQAFQLNAFPRGSIAGIYNAYFNGLVDNARIYSRSYDEIEILNLP